MARVPDRQVEASGKVWTLRFSIRALAAMQEHFGLASLDEMGTRLTEGITTDDIVAIFWAGLRTHHPEATQDDAAGIADDLGMADAMEIISTGLGAAMGGESADAAPADPRKPGRSKK